MGSLAVDTTNTALRVALYWGKNSLKARKLILNFTRTEIYEITAKGRAHLKTYKMQPSAVDSEFFDED